MRGFPTGRGQGNSWYAPPSEADAEILEYARLLFWRTWPGKGKGELA